MGKTVFQFCAQALLCVLSALGTVGVAWAQDSEIETAFRRVSPEEEVHLRAILRAPLERNGLTLHLENQLQEKSHAARRLSDAAEEERVLREGLALLDRLWMRNNLAILLRRRDIAEATALHKKLVDAVVPSAKPFYMGHVAYDYYLAYENGKAEAEIAKARALFAEQERTENRPAYRRTLLRGARKVWYVLSLLEQRKGNWTKAVDAARQAERYGREALATSHLGDKTNYPLLAEDVADTLARKTQALRSAGRLAEAEESLREYIRFAAEVELPANYQAGIYRVAGNLRFAQRDFTEAERLARKAEKILQALDGDARNLGRVSLHGDIIVALAGQGRWRDALAELERLDAVTKDDESSRQWALLHNVRGWVYLGNQMFEQAAPLFEQLASRNLRTYGAGHYFVAQARGLQGVALWRLGGTGNRKRAFELLRAAVDDLVSVRNADYLDQFGIRPEMRQTIVATYVEAAAELDETLVLQAVGLADWLHAGATQEALSDAAVRMAARTPRLADLVREEQDAKHEVKGLRGDLEVREKNAVALSDEITGRMRARISSLEKTRAQLQSQIQAEFPEYEQLVRPLPPKLEQIGAQLALDETLLVIMPDSSGVSLWAVWQEAGQTAAKYYRAPIDAARLSQGVSELRRSLESLSTQGRALPFDHALAHRMFQVLLEPLMPEMQRRRNWIVATSGAVATLPLAVLETRPPAASDGQPEWLIQKVSLSQVPSVASWLNMRGLGRRQLPAQALLAWGDPVFDSARPRQPASAIRNIVVSGVELHQFEQDVPNPSRIYRGIPPLPDTRDELLGIAQALHSDPAQDVILGEQATRASVLRASASGRLAQKKVVAFATHGLVAGDLPRLTQPALALSADGSESSNPLGPLLLLEDVLGLRLNADWVVLSACNTAAADGRADEALSGLARGFFYAGGRSLLVTHWAVESESARALTTRTFEHFAAEGSASKAENLRQAMLEVMAMPQYRHPAFWAPYALVGDPQR